MSGNFDIGGGEILSNGTTIIGDIDEAGGFTLSDGAIGVNQGGSTVLSAGELCTPYFGDANVNTLIDASAGDGSMIVQAPTTFASTVATSQLLDNFGNMIIDMSVNGFTFFPDPPSMNQLLDGSNNLIIDASAGNGTAIHRGFFLESFATADLPDPTAEGRMVYDSTSKTAKISNGTTWLEL